jgi:hypothetical protein
VQTEDTPLAHEAVRRIAGLYAVEAQVRGQSPVHRLAARRTLAKPSAKHCLWIDNHLRRAHRASADYKTLVADMTVAGDRIAKGLGRNIAARWIRSEVRQVREVGQIRTLPANDAENRLTSPGMTGHDAEFSLG